MSGAMTVAGTTIFALTILLSNGRLIDTPGWKPLVDFVDGYAVIGGILLVSGLLGIAGLAFDGDDKHKTPRRLTLASAWIGAMWFSCAAVAFTVAWFDGWTNAGPFLAAPAVLLHVNRIWILSEPGD